MKFYWDNHGWISFGITLGILVVIFVLLVFAFYKMCRRRAAFVILAFSFVFSLVSIILDLVYLGILSAPNR